MTDGKNPAAVALGRLGGLANTPAQIAARKRPKPGAGRPRKDGKKPRKGKARGART